MRQYLEAYFGDDVSPEAVDLVSAANGESLDAIKAKLQRIYSQVGHTNPKLQRIYSQVGHTNPKLQWIYSQVGHTNPKLQWIYSQVGHTNPQAAVDVLTGCLHTNPTLQRMYSQFGYTTVPGWVFHSRRAVNAYKGVKIQLLMWFLLQGGCLDAAKDKLPCYCSQICCQEDSKYCTHVRSGASTSDSHASTSRSLEAAEEQKLGEALQIKGLLYVFDYSVLPAKIPNIAHMCRVERQHPAHMHPRAAALKQKRNRSWVKLCRSRGCCSRTQKRWCLLCGL